MTDVKNGAALLPVAGATDECRCRMPLTPALSQRERGLETMRPNGRGELSDPLSSAASSVVSSCAFR